MKTAHTPGPWSRGNRGGVVVAPQPLPGYTGAGGHDEVDYYGGHLIAESIWRQEDARLIAAAPQLLEVAQDFNEALQELGLFCECGRPDCRTTRLRAAIAKATGNA